MDLDDLGYHFTEMGHWVSERQRGWGEKHAHVVLGGEYPFLFQVSFHYCQAQHATRVLRWCPADSKEASQSNDDF